MFSCSEHLAGLDASQGTELCTIVETMYSYAVIGNILGAIAICIWCVSVSLYVLVWMTLFFFCRVLMSFAQAT